MTAVCASKIQTLLQKEKEAISHFFDEVDPSLIERFVEKLEAAPGLVVFTGVGKSGIVAKKIAVTLTSTGSKALFLSPSNALHGDIGILGPGDLFVALSKSGETEELLSLVPYVREKGAEIVVVVSREDCRLAKAADFTVILPLLFELCPFNLAPTISTVIQMIFGDIVAISLMEQRKFSLEEYARNHPAGQIGKRSKWKVSDLMLSGSDLPLAKPSQTVMEVLVELSNKRSGCLMVVSEEKELLGIFTDGDLRRALVKYGKDTFENKVESLMTTKPSRISKHLLASAALKQMEENPLRPVTVLPVINEEGKVEGLIRLHDILQAGI